MLPSSAQSHKASNNGIPPQLIPTQEVPDFEEIQDFELSDSTGAKGGLRGGFRSQWQELNAILDRQVETHNYYDSIALVALNGNVIAKSQGEDLPNLSDRDYFQAVIKTNRPFIGRARVSRVTGKFTIFMAAPVRDTVSSEMTTVLRTSKANLVTPILRDNQLFGLLIAH